MIYLDYSATTPVLYEVLDSYTKTTKEFMGNANSLHSLGIKSKELLESATKQICNLLNIKENELTYTSGATESNNMAIKGVALKNHKSGKHIIVSKLEHPSVYAICDYLKSIGFKISYVNNDSAGLIDFEDLKKQITKDTILVSICAVNSELGIRQPLKTIRQIIKKQNPKTLFHSDMTQSFGKVNMNMADVDLASISGHKIYGPKGIGLLYVNEKVQIEPLIHGSGTFNPLKYGTPPLPLIVALSKAVRLSLHDLEKKESFVQKLNERLCKNLLDYPEISINKTKYSIPHILNISLKNIRPETFIHAMEEHEIYLGTNTACTKGAISAAIEAVYNDEERASTSIRISISYLTTTDEITKFLTIFDKVYRKLYELNN